MQIDRAATHGILATIYVAEHEDAGPVRAHEMARECGTPLAYLQKILGRLSRSRVLEAVRGRSGGFCLRKRPGETTLLEILEAIDGPLTSQFAAGRGIKVSRKSHRKIETLCEDLAGHARAKLGRVTVKQLMR